MHYHLFIHGPRHATHRGTRPERSDMSTADVRERRTHVSEVHWMLSHTVGTCCSQCARAAPEAGSWPRSVQLVPRAVLFTGVFRRTALGSARHQNIPSRSGKRQASERHLVTPAPRRRAGHKNGRPRLHRAGDDCRGFWSAAPRPATRVMLDIHLV